MEFVGDYFDARFSRQADVRIGAIEAFTPPNRYQVRLLLTGRIVWATPANRGDVFGIGELVCLNSPSASRAALGTGDLIVSRAPEEQQGLIGGSVTDDANLSGVTILSVSPRPLVLEQGGAPGDVVITGSGFLTPPTFDVGSGVSNDSAATVTPTQITVHAHADALAPLGMSGLKIGTRRVKDVFRVIAPAPVYLWIAYTTPNITLIDEPRVAKLDLATLAVLATYTGTAFSGMTPSGIVITPSTVSAMFYSYMGAGHAQLVSHGLASGITTVASMPLVDAVVESELTWNGAKLAMLSVAAGYTIYEFDPDGTDVTAFHTTSTGARIGLLWDAANSRYIANGPTLDLDRVTAGGEAPVIGLNGSRMLSAGGFYWLADANNARVRKLDPATFGVLQDIATPSASPIGLATDGTYLYVVQYGPPAKATKIELATGNIIASVALAASSRFCAIHGTTLYTVSSSGAGTVQAIDTATMTVTASNATFPAGSVLSTLAIG